ncbi:hypothetical protein AMK27_05010 [Streptomyces sp. CB02009]|nr:hypothetical protein AMK27_05010 [Streptomyces sp. CB02009]
MQVLAEVVLPIDLLHDVIVPLQKRSKRVHSGASGPSTLRYPCHMSLPHLLDLADSRRDHRQGGAC